MATMKQLMKRPAARAPESTSGGGKGPQRGNGISTHGKTSHEMAKRFTSGGKKRKR